MGLLLNSETLSAVRTSHNRSTRRSAVRRAAGRAVPRKQSSAASLTSEGEPCIGGYRRPGSAKVMRAGPLRSGKLMASGGCRYTEDRERFRGFPGSAAAELVITEAFS